MSQKRCLGSSKYYHLSMFCCVNSNYRNCYVYIISPLKLLRATKVMGEANGEDAKIKQCLSLYIYVLYM